MKKKLLKLLYDNLGERNILSFKKIVDIIHSDIKWFHESISNSPDHSGKKVPQISQTIPQISIDNSLYTSLEKSFEKLDTEATTKYSNNSPECNSVLETTKTETSVIFLNHIKIQ